MKKTLIVLSLVACAAVLSACGGGGGGGGGGGTVVVTPPPPADANAKFGAQFAADFKASPDYDPAAVSSTDIVPVDPSADPSPVH